MGCKGQRRREKNFRAAHGDDKRLPPPPTQKELDAIPAKLRRLMVLQKNSAPTAKKNGSLRVDVKKGGSGSGSRERGGKQHHVQLAKDSQFDLADKINETVSHVEKEDHDEMKQKKKGKRKRKLDDLHIQNLTMAADQLTKRKRRKDRFLKERKKKKNKKQKNDDDIREFPGHEDIKFGEVVQAPPKLSLPKAFSSLGASHERLRLKAVESYRNRKGWVARPGMQFPLEPTSQMQPFLG